MLAISLVLVLGSAASMYKYFSIVHRQHKVLRLLLNPVAPMVGLVEYSLGIANHPHGAVTPIAEDARQTPAYQQKSKKTVVIFVLGEAARSMNFQLNGYARATNPVLSTYPVINFPNTWSCGTATAESVPCMFSMLTRSHYSTKKAKSQESLMDVMKRAGVNAVWRDNNSSCKGACDRTGSEDMRFQQDPALCRKGECLDEILLQGLQEKIDAMQGDVFIVLHQKGSHGPEYFRRSPDSMKKFMPECDKASVMDCPRDSIVNAYDNTILYTDFFLGKVIDFLQQNSTRYDTAMFYMSDHGESLGENNIYLHGFPYAIAPEEQRHIPFIAWFSDNFVTATGLDLACIRSRAANEYSHDDLFHTALGLLGVATTAYLPEHDVFNPCRH
jgi:lipid A ethanolaminephosphotransferase